MLTRAILLVQAQYDHNSTPEVGTAIIACNNNTPTLLTLYSIATSSSEVRSVDRLLQSQHYHEPYIYIYIYT